MAKKTPAKKPRRRLKRSIRRSLSAVLMVTAIAVAAIPVPENYADNGDAVTRVAVIEDKHDMKKYGYDSDSDPGESSTVTVDLNKYKDKSPEEIFKDYDETDGPVRASLKIRNIDGDYKLSWQFLYYEVKDPQGTTGRRGVVCKYNGEYITKKATLPLNPITKYYTISSEVFNSYFNGTIKNYATYSDTNPNADIEYSYQDYLSFKKNGEAETRAFFVRYFSVALAEKESAFSTYEAYEKQYDQDKKNYDNGITDEDPGTKESAPESLIRKPTDISQLPDQMEFFCEHDKVLKNMTEPSLYSVSDERPNSDGGTVYAARVKGVPAGSDYRIDYGEEDEDGSGNSNEGGFLVVERTPNSLCGIGAGAFKDNDKIETLVISNMIGYIGDEAFEGASLIKTISLNNVSYIGNRAFKDCKALVDLTIGEGTNVIGKECFYNTGVETIVLPSTITNIGYGAFAHCRKLTKASLNMINKDCVMAGYAFYDCSSLNEVEMSDSSIVAIGDGAFAVNSGGAEMAFVFPQGMESKYDSQNSIGDYIFAGRSSLKSVKFPLYYGSSSNPIKLPSNMFHQCSNLEYVEFPSDKDHQYSSGGVSYDPDLLFSDVVNKDFLVKGPKMKNISEPAEPRVSTWDAKTAVSDTVTYMYVENGVEYYEISDGTYLLCISKEGILTSCTFKPKLDPSKKKNVKLVIPAQVGETPVTGIDDQCFKKDSELNEEVISLTIEDGASLSEIGDGVFQGGGGDNNKDWLKLRTVYIGDSVAEIGNYAFEGCKKLSDVTFSSPTVGHEAFKLGTDAFKTGVSSLDGGLTFHGDIVEGYDPFDWAMDPKTIINEDPDEKNLRVCYKSLAPTYLSVMYNPITDMVTLLDYPKSDQISNLLKEAHIDELRPGQSYEDWREEQLYRRYESGDSNDRKRATFARLWKNAEDRKVLYNDKEYYGPWINKEFCDNWEKWADGTLPENPEDSNISGSSTEEPTPAPDITHNGLTDWLFEPLVAYAAEDVPSIDNPIDPKPYYDIYEYNIWENGNDPYRPQTDEEGALIQAVTQIVVPKGVDSIDVYGYINNRTKEGKEADVKPNTLNYQTYFDDDWNFDIKKMYNGSKVTDTDGAIIQPGLFSGSYKDETDPNQIVRGNDRITSVILESVKYLPNYAFDSCENLVWINIGECSDIGTAPFRGCDSLQSVSNNEYYTTDNFIIYSNNTDGSRTIEECLPSRGKGTGYGPGLITATDNIDPLLKDVSSIKKGAFENCKHITSVDFGVSDTAGLLEIPEDCFKNCTGLQTVTLPQTVNDVGSGAFVGANKLTGLTVYGKEVKISGSAFENTKENPKELTTVYTYNDSAVVRYVKEYGDVYELIISPKPLDDYWQVTFLDANYLLIENLKDLDDNDLDNPQPVQNGKTAIEPREPVMDGWEFDSWVGTNGITIKTPIHQNTIFYANGYSTNGMVGGKYVVEFYDQNGTKLKTQYVLPGGDAEPPFVTPPNGYIFDTWLSDGNKSLTNIQSNATFIASYKAIGGNGGTSGNTTNTSSGTSNTSNNAANTPGGTSRNTTSSSNNTTSSSNNTTSSSNNTTSSSNASTSSTSAASAGLYALTVINGSGSGSYAAGTTVVIQANTPAAGSVFQRWMTESQGVTLASVSTTPTTFVMPANNVTITAEFTADIAPAATPTSTGGNGSNTDGGNTRVDILKPGISNKDLATANVNGSTDNFIIKITETDDATRAVADALTNKYGSLDNILYYAMDISLWDATGSYRLTGDQLAGITVDITIPIPDALVAYGGNNMAGAVINGNQLENLNENFTTINGVPCIRFTATHFSPYTVYVDTGNLTEGMLDATPKTGDPIHPKWFLSIGLACLSIILFMKKDKKVKVKTA